MPPRVQGSYVLDEDMVDGGNRPSSWFCFKFVEDQDEDAVYTYSAEVVLPPGAVIANGILIRESDFSVQGTQFVRLYFDGVSYASFEDSTIPSTDSTYTMFYYFLYGSGHHPVLASPDPRTLKMTITSNNWTSNEGVYYAYFNMLLPLDAIPSTVAVGPAP